MEDYRQSEEYSQYYSNKGWNVEKVGNTRVLIKNIPLIGSFIKIQRGSANTSLVDIDNYAKRNKALLVVIEPNIKTEDARYKSFELELTNYGYNNLNIFLSPTKTTYIDLNQKEEDILASFDQDIRKGLRKNTHKNITFKIVKDIEEIYSVLHEAGHKQNIFIQTLDDWKNKWGLFGDQIQVILAYLDGTLLGGNMFTIKPPVAYGLFLPTTELGKENKIAATLIWEAVKLTKESGCTQFDLNGLYDDRYNLPKRWQGLTAFKRKFNGREVEFMHPKVKVYSKYFKPLGWLGLFWMFFADS